MALDSPWVDMGIAFHSSGLKKELWYNLRAWEDYQSSRQNEKPLSLTQKAEALKADGVNIKGITGDALTDLYDKHFGIKVLIDEKGKRFYPHFSPRDMQVKTAEGMVTIPGHKNDRETFLNLCKQFGVLPRFDGVMVQYEGRTVHAWEHPNYMKFVKEVARTGTEQKPVQYNLYLEAPNLPTIGKEKSMILYGKENAERIGRHMTSSEYGMYLLYDHANRGGYDNVQQYEKLVYDSGFGDIAGEFIADVINAKEERPLDYISDQDREMFRIVHRALYEEAGLDPETAPIPYHPEHNGETSSDVQRSVRAGKMTLGETFSKDKKSFDSVRERAIREKGIVMPNLNKEVLPIVKVSKMAFPDGTDSAIEYARKWAESNLTTKEGETFPTMRDGTPYQISNGAIKKYLSDSSVGKTGDLGVHLSVLTRLKDVINSSIKVEIHPDYPKGKDSKRISDIEADNIGKNILIHRLYGAVSIDGRVYRVKTTMHEYRGSEPNKPHNYEVTEIELLNDSSTAENTAQVEIPVHGEKRKC